MYCVDIALRPRQVGLKIVGVNACSEKLYGSFVPVAELVLR